MSNTSTPLNSEGSNQQLEEQLSPEEYSAYLAKDGSGEEEESTKVEECVCSFFDAAMSQPTLEQYQQGELKNTPLFANVYTLDKEGEQVCIERPSDDPDTSILVTGFGIRNLASLQDALDLEERRRLFHLYDSQEPVEVEKELEQEQRQFVDLTQLPPARESSKRSIETETELSAATSDISVQQEKVRYLMGLQAEPDEEEAYPEKEDLVRDMLTRGSEDRFVFSQVSTTKSAQIYLRSHRIFDFFQFIIAHLLSASPENPITFILVLLNKILLYRAGTGVPPLLYERKHIEQLFKMMDRLNSGYIDVTQYVSGMNTLGICEYNKEPALSDEGLISMDVFVHEVLEAETALFNDLIKRKWTGSKPIKETIFSDITTPVRSYISGYSLIPPDMSLKGARQMKLPDGDEEA